MFDGESFETTPTPKVVGYTHLDFEDVPQLKAGDFDGDGDIDVLSFKSGLGCDSCSPIWFEQK